MSAVLFFIAAIGALSGAIGVVMLRNPFYSVLALVCHLIALAALFLLLRAEFVAAAQVVVYAGAVMVLYVFVVAYVGGSDEPLHRPGGALKVLGPLFGLAVAVELCIAMLGTALKGITTKGAPFVPGFGSPRHIGRLFLTTYLFPFEVASLLLLVAAIGAVVLARRRRGLDPAADEIDDPLLRPARPAYTGTMAEATGLRAGGGTGGQGPNPPEPTEPIGAPTGGRDGGPEGGW
jgi:NADH-quinone oxidoreductase subunit J